MPSYPYVGRRPGEPHSFTVDPDTTTSMTLSESEALARNPDGTIGYHVGHMPYVSSCNERCSTFMTPAELMAMYDEEDETFDDRIPE